MWRMCAASLCCAFGCSFVADSDPRPERVEPGLGNSGSATPITIHGNDFHLDIRISYSSSSRSYVHDGFSARLGVTPLLDLVRLDSSTLTAVVPAGLTAGSYELVVVDPAGRSGALAAAFTVRGASEVNDTVDIVAVDPLADGSTFAFVFTHGGRLWLGPRADGTGAVHYALDGSDRRESSFTFPRDSVGNTHDNTSTPPYVTIGAPGCGNNTPECGPDNEKGDAFFTSGTIAGSPWLFVSGARNGGNLDYIYATSETTGDLTFRFIDTSSVLGGNTRSFLSAHVFRDRVYLGNLDPGGGYKSLIGLMTTPALPGLDASGNGGGPCDPTIHDACHLAGGDIPGVGTATNHKIDVITDFNDRLYLANDGGVGRSTTNQPLDADDFPADWTDATPTHPAYVAKSSLTTSKLSGFTPADLAAPALVVFAARLYLARNTEDGPQLWSCDPAVVDTPAPATATACDPGDWSLVAPNSTGDLELCQYDNPGNTRVTLLAATTSYLYVGFDNAIDGAVILRTANTAAAIRGDFVGLADCDAADHATTCQGIGGNGVGAGVSRLLSATVVQDGTVESLYVVAGDGVAPIRVLRLSQ